MSMRSIDTDPEVSHDQRNAVTMLPGLDVSHWEGKVDWAQVCQAGYRFAFTKATEGVSYVDDTFLPNMTGAQSQGLPISAYHFFHLTLPAKAQADYYLSQIKNVRLDLPPVLDFEEYTSLPKTQAAAALKTWLDIVEAATGRKPIIYTGLYYWQDAIGSPAWANDYPLWIAQYTPAPQPTIPTCWKTWTFWQYTDKGSVPGCQGSVDLDRASLDEAGLQALCKSWLANDHGKPKPPAEPKPQPGDDLVASGTLEERVARLEKTVQELTEMLKGKNLL
jgi:lysozyme